MEHAAAMHKVMLCKQMPLFSQGLKLGAAALGIFVEKRRNPLGHKGCGYVENLVDNVYNLL